MSDLPKDYDVIIVGTGLTESILAAALARVGKTVLHIDRNQFYGGEFASHTLSNLIEWSQNIVNKSFEEYSTDNESTIKCNNNLRKYYTEIEYSWNTSLDPEIEDKLTKLSRKFTLDLSPNIFYSRGDLIELLISSDVAKYCEFKMVSQILTMDRDGILQKVPTSRSEVFKSNKLGMLEKRVMMQFVQSCLKDDNFKDLIQADKLEKVSFKELILSKKFPQNISDFLINAVSMCSNESDTALKGLKETKKFLTSVGRFGDSPFLYSMYGAGELTQCFCRMAAVFGAIYYLDLSIDKFHLNNETKLIESITTRNDKEEYTFSCKNVIIDSSYAPLDYITPTSLISRCILITNKSIYKAQDEIDHISLLHFPISPGINSSVYVIETSYASNCCPQEYFVVYMFCENKMEATKENFEICIDKLFATKNESDKPNILFSYFYSHLDSDNLVKDINRRSDKPSNLHVVSGAKCQIDFDHHVSEAKKIFNTICPDDPFMPKPPDQEDIIFDDNQETSEQKQEKLEEQSQVETLLDTKTHSENTNQ